MFIAVGLCLFHFVCGSMDLCCAVSVGLRTEITNHERRKTQINEIPFGILKSKPLNPQHLFQYSDKTELPTVLGR